MLRLLIIEDDIIDQMAIRRLLAQSPDEYNYHIADSLQDGIHTLQKEDFDLVISDYNLSDGSAIELLEQGVEIPIIIITGMNDQKTRERLIEKGAFQVMVKDNQLRYIRNLPQLIKTALQNDHQGSSSDTPVQVQKPGPAGETIVENFTLDHLIDTFDGNIEFVTGIIKTFLTQNPVSIDELNGAVSRADFNQIAMVAHKIKSGYRLMGFQNQLQLAEQIESDAQIGPEKHSTIKHMLSRLIDNNKSVEKFLRGQLEILN